ncbi:CopG family transcriptional regulator [Methylomonas koyamae]|uniref:CopG family transcriptional regulator n=1 Tax=Methylomonas koyamae TaxID=702114 RepID=A0A177NBV8_9GAMM|nr:DUF411 domain-containing protein [Methylomonas koyamae]OAI15528.1 CopG family transcriptional regulator [Methylomonas koyamae]WNB76177.1 DUF411 domain-containing protein [Methylomonas koyamae]
MKLFRSTAILVLASFGFSACAEQTAAGGPEMTVYRSPTCGCCGKWLEHARQSGFKINDVISDDMDAIKARYGVPEKLASCHTAIVDGYVVEGHVPAGDIQKMLQAKPQVAGLAAPGMPMGSPGMEMGGRHDTYQVVSFDKAGKAEVFAEHGDNR